MNMRLSTWTLGVFALLGLATVLQATEVTPKIEKDMAWYDTTQWEPEGRGWSDTLRYYDRLPAKAEKTVRPPVWSLSRDSTGMIVRFTTDADRIEVRYKLFKSRIAMNHMPAVGVSGVDLYVKHEGQWHWLGVSRPNSQDVKYTVARGLSAEPREYMMYLPLYNGIDSLEIGVPKNASFKPIAPRKEKPIVYYGTSIAQGGCASRPGMAHPAILGRKLDHPVINLGFSGNGRMDLEVGELMAELDPAMYVIDCVPNVNAQIIAERAEPLVKILRKARPDVPIVLVEGPNYGNQVLVEGIRTRSEESRVALKKAYTNLQADGVKNLYYIKGDQLFGSDDEATVDGTHPTDLGMLRQANVMAPILRKILKK